VKFVDEPAADNAVRHL